MHLPSLTPPPSSFLSPFLPFQMVDFPHLLILFLLIVCFLPHLIPSPPMVDFLLCLILHFLFLFLLCLIIFLLLFLHCPILLLRLINPFQSMRTSTHSWTPGPQTASSMQNL